MMAPEFVNTTPFPANRAQRRFAKRATRRTDVREPDRTAWAATLIRSSETDTGVALDIAIKLADAFNALRAGSTDDDLFDRLAAAVNVGLIRAEQIDPLLEQTMLAARDALVACAGIHARHGRYGFRGPDLQAMTDALEAYDAIVRASTPHQMQAALDESLRRIRAGAVLALD